MKIGGPSAPHGAEADDGNMTLPHLGIVDIWGGRMILQDGQMSVGRWRLGVEKV
jgi:hypothetical protein